MPQPSGSIPLVIDLDFELREHLPDIHDNSVRSLIFDHTAVDRNHPVAAGLVHTGDDLSPSVKCKSRCHLVAVVEWILHADDLLHMTEPPQEFDLPELFMMQLLDIAHTLQLAASALLILRAL